MDQKIMQYAVIGNPIGHTMSPPIHQALFEMSGKQCEYHTLQISSEELLSKREFFLTLNGFNVTIPHKVSVIPCLDELDESAERCGAVNTVSRKGNRLIGYNTDIQGFLKTVEQMKLPVLKRVCVVGAGGVGRMFAAEAARMDCEITVAVRGKNLNLAQKLQQELLEKKLIAKGQLQIVLTTDTLPKSDLLINATPAGMYPNTDDCPVSDQSIQNAGAVLDAVYNPTRTRFLQKAAEFSVPAKGGMEMLVWQAAYAHQIWDGSQYPAEKIEELVQKMSRQVDLLFPVSVSGRDFHE